MFLDTRMMQTLYFPQLREIETPLLLTAIAGTEQGIHQWMDKTLVKSKRVFIQAGLTPISIYPSFYNANHIQHFPLYKETRIRRMGHLKDTITITLFHY